MAFSQHHYAECYSRSDFDFKRFNSYAIIIIQGKDTMSNDTLFTMATPQPPEIPLFKKNITGKYLILNPNKQIKFKAYLINGYFIGYYAYFKNGIFNGDGFFYENNFMGRTTWYSN